MKRTCLIIASLLLPLYLFSQAPEKLNFQGVIRDASNNLVTKSTVGMQISILMGSVSGSPVYVETHAPTSDENGVITIEIGGGSVVSGSLNGIDWGSGPYFLKTETDPNGGTSYTLSGTSQLLSVPYALYAESANNAENAKTAETAQTAETLTGGITETDPLFGASVAGGITAIDTASWNNHIADTHIDSVGIASLGYVAGPHTDSAAIAEMGYVAGGKSYKVGDFAHGGIVFWVDEAGQSGLVCAKKDHTSNIQWYNGSYMVTDAQGDGISAGELNTLFIILAQGADRNDYAAGVCANLKVTENGSSFGGWYLPSKEELGMMYESRDIIDSTAVANGGSAFAVYYYYSSTEISDIATWGLSFNNGVYNVINKSNSFKVRAVRRF